MRLFITIILLGWIVSVSFGDIGALAAPTPRDVVSINRVVVKLKDLFTDPGTLGYTVLGPAPPPGGRFTVGARQLAAIARRYRVGWTDITSGASVTIERPGVPISESAVVTALRPALTGAGAPAHFVIQLADTRLPMIPPGETPKILINQITYHHFDGRFEVYALLTAPAMNPRSMAISGIANPSRQAIVAVRTLSPGEIVGDADVALKWITQTAFPQGAVTDLADAVGMKISRRVARGAALARRFMTQPMMVDRGATVAIAVAMPNLEVTAEGVALAAGGKGAVIPVLNPSSQEVVQAVIDGRNHAHVLPGSQPSPSRAQAPYYSMMGGRK